MTKSPAPTNALSTLRAAAGLSQHEVADLVNAWAATGGKHSVGVTANTVSRWERGTVVPSPFYRRALADVFGVSIDALGLAQHAEEPAPMQATTPMHDGVMSADPRVAQSQENWRRTRRALNANRAALTQFAAGLYDARFRLGTTGLITHPSWLPAEPVDLAAIQLEHDAAAPPPKLDGTEPESSHVRPASTLVRPYARYTHAIRDLERPRLFENRASWRLLDLEWSPGAGRMSFGDTTYFAGVDMYEATAHEMALVHLDENGATTGTPTMRDLPFRKLVGDPFDLARRPVLPSISTLTVRKESNGDASFILHRRDPKSVAVAGGMLQVIPSGVFQPSSVMPAAVAADFDLWRNIMREYSEELLGNPEHDGDGQPIRYDGEPFRSLDAARAAGALQIWCLGVALDALTLVGEILTVAVFDAATFDNIAQDFVELNDEGSVVNERIPFSDHAIDQLLKGRSVAPAGAGCINLASNWRTIVHG